MRKFSRLALLWVLATGLDSSFAGALNTAAAGAVSYQVGQGWMSFAVDESAQDRWLSFVEVGGRSYCLEATTGSASYVPLDPSLTLYSDINGTTQLATNGDGGGEPRANKGARICYMSTLAAGATAARSAKINVPIVAASGDSGYVKARVVETTQFSPFWEMEVGGSTYSVFGYANTTNSTVNLKISLTQWVNNGAMVYPGPYHTVSLAPHASGVISTWETWQYPGLTLNARNSGSSILTHDGPPGAISAYIQSDSAEGKSIYRPFLPRQQ